MTRAEAIRRIGGEPDRIMNAVRPKGAIHAYLELHIEQGGTLDKASRPDRRRRGHRRRFSATRATVTGFANHAGTTPMAERQDALVAASQLTIAVREVVTSRPGRQVGTVGQLDVSPNAPNVIPGSVTLTIELRDLSTRQAPRHRRRDPRARAPESRRLDDGTTIDISAEQQPARARVA